MSYTNVYPSRINWENEPSIASPINATNLNKIDYAVYEHDQTFETWDVTKANQSDLLLSVKSIDYDTETGVFVFTWQNGTTKTVDLNIEKIPVSFSMSPQGVITMTTDDGTTYTADVGSLIKTYTFTDSSEIDFTVTTDASGNKTITAGIVAGSITGSKLEPNYLANCQSAANSASGSATAADGSAEDSEAWAVGTRDGVPVPSTDPAYENNSKYWAEHTTNSFAGLTDTDITNPQNGQVPVYNSTSQKWENADQSAGGGSKVVVSTAEASLIGTTCTLSQGGDSYTATFSNSGVATFKGVTLTGTVTITATDGQSTATRTLEIPYFGNYTQTISFFSATITATFPADKGATCTCDGVTASTSPYTFTVGTAGTYSVVCTLDGVNKSVSVPISTDGQAESVNFAFGTINLTYDNEFRGLSITCTDSNSTITKTAPISGNSMAFYPPNTGTWTISGTYSGTPYTTTATVSSLSTAVTAQLRTTVNATVTLHGAAGAIISWTDEAGSQTQTLDTGGSKTDVTIKANPNFPVIVFEDTTVGKKPCDLSANFKKSVVIKPSLTDIYVMPDNSLYWYGYEDSDLEDMTSANGWSVSSYSFINPTHNGTFISLAPNNTNGVSGIGTKNTITYDTVNAIAQGITLSSFYGLMRTYGTKNMSNDIDSVNISSNSMAKYSISRSTTNYAAIWTSATRAMNVSALYYNTSSDYNFFSAVDDVVTFKDSNNNDVVFAITDENGGAYVDYSAIPSGSYTLYSSVAKNPDSLSDAYSKQVSISSGTTSVYFMPNDNVLYWYGYMSSACEDLSTANGWGITSGYSYVAPTHNKNHVLISAGNNQASGIGTKASTNATKVYSVNEGVTLVGSKYGNLSTLTSKSLVSTAYNRYTEMTSSSITKYSIDLTGASQNVYIAEDILSGRSTKCYALWYE